MTCKKATIRFTANYFTDVVKAKSQWNSMLKTQKEINFQCRILYPAITTFKIKNTFPKE